MPIDASDQIWMDGTLVPWDEAKVHVLTHTLHYGNGAFEGIRAYETPKGTAVFRLTEHIERLFESCKILMIDIPYTVDELIDNGIQADLFDHLFAILPELGLRAFQSPAGADLTALVGERGAST